MFPAAGMRRRKTMSVKVALASTDGKVVNEHFGRARNFLIFDVSKSGFEFVKRVEVEPACDGGSHEVAAFARIADALSGTKAVFAAKIGEGAAAYFESRGFSVFESPCPIRPLLEKVVKDNLIPELQ